MTPWAATRQSAALPAKGPAQAMSNTTVLITDMAILVAIFALGFLAKMFPKNGRNAGHKQ